ncbi:MAG: hypothetical protein R2761_09680 [Acidimicrobiales bacterium]
MGHLIDEGDIAAEQAKMDEGEWRRAYATQFHDRNRIEDLGPISIDDWRRLEDPSSQAEGRLVYGVAVSVDRQRASIGVAADSSSGGLHVELIDSRPGTLWVAQTLMAIIRRNGGAGIAIDPSSPAGSLVAEIETVLRELPEGERPELFKMSTRDHAAAAGALVDRVSPPDGTAPVLRRPPGQPDLDDAVEAARKRAMGDGAWGFARLRSETDISPLEAVTMALGGFLCLAEEEVQTEPFIAWVDV